MDEALTGASMVSESSTISAPSGLDLFAALARGEL